MKGSAPKSPALGSQTLVKKKPKPNLWRGRTEPRPEFENEQKSDEDRRGGEDKRDQTRDFVAVAEAIQKRARARDRARAVNGSSGCSHCFCDSSLRLSIVRAYARQQSELTLDLRTIESVRSP